MMTPPDHPIELTASGRLAVVPRRPSERHESQNINVDAAGRRARRSAFVAWVRFD
jgi:hypothetical protein